jgi:hypothetical protein
MVSRTVLFLLSFALVAAVPPEDWLAANPAQYPALYQAWAKSQAGPVYWSVVEALMRSQP